MATKEYKHSFKGLVAKVGYLLHATPDCETMRYMYREKLARRARAQDDPSTLSGLRLLEAMEEAGVFGYSRPEGLLKVLEEVGRDDLHKLVEQFIDDRQHTIASLQNPHNASLRSRKKPDRDGPMLPPYPTPSPAEEDPYQMMIPFLKFHNSPPSSDSPVSSLSSSSSSSLSVGRGGSEEEDCYSYVCMAGPDSWLVTDQYPQLKMDQKMRLLTKPLREMIRRGENHTITTPPIHLPLHPLVFSLHIDSLGHYNSVGASLYLLKGVKTNILLKADITIRHPFPLKQNPKKTTHTATSTSHVDQAGFVLFRATVAMDLPSEATPIGRNIVARFPMMISHQNMLNRRIVRAPFLEVKISISQLQ